MAFKPVAVENGKLLIGGEWSAASTGKTFETINPSTEKPLASVAFGSAEDVDRAVAAARHALEAGPWSKMSARERGRLMFKLADLIERDKEKLAILESMDNGKPINETMYFDIPQVIETFRYYAGWADKIYGDVNPVGGEYFSYTLKEPAGVVGQIIPWNFPALMAAWKLAPALATGCTSILKPAEQTPLTAIELGKLICEAGFPAGVVNVVTGDGSTGAALSNHKGVDKIAFTGSTEVGREVMIAAARNLKRVSMELGGKAPNIVFADANVDQAVRGAILGIYFNQGEVCCAGSRLFLHKAVEAEFLDKFKKFAETIKVGDPLDKSTQMGAQVSMAQYERIVGFLESGKKSGAKVIAGGNGLRDKLGGYFVQPTLFAETNQQMQIVKEEIFGPVLAAQSFEDLEDLVGKANDTNYGLSAGIWTQDITKAHTVARRLKAGTVWINCYNAFDTGVPFGGFKESGFGRELGRQALDLYTGEKAVWVGGLNAK
jgi:acyl-CoA reductase-like NAD-dependent aldehyde dehydrogenase